MSYQISEKNLERQKLLATTLNRISKKYLAKIPPENIHTLLDLGCGLGETTRMLSKTFPHASCTGLDMNEQLIAYGESQESPNIDYQAADATKLPFPDHHFDFIFTRYLLIHVPDPKAVLKEMKRVCKKGGIIFIQESDMRIEGGLYPQNWAYDLLVKAYHVLYSDSQLGRKMPTYFEACGLPAPTIRCDTFLMHTYQQGVSKKLSRMTGEAILDNMLSKKLLDEDKAEAFIEELKRIEEDPSYSLLTDPVVTMWAKISG